MGRGGERIQESRLRVGNRISGCWGCEQLAYTFLSAVLGIELKALLACTLTEGAVPSPLLTFEALAHTQSQPVLGPLYNPRVVEEHAREHCPLSSHHGLIGWLLAEASLRPRQSQS